MKAVANEQWAVTGGNQPLTDDALAALAALLCDLAEDPDDDHQEER